MLKMYSKFLPLTYTLTGLRGGSPHTLGQTLTAVGALDTVSGVTRHWARSAEQNVVCQARERVHATVPYCWQRAARHFWKTNNIESNYM